MTALVAQASERASQPAPAMSPNCKLLTGNQAAAYGAHRSGVQVASAYPITPQTTVIETLAELMVQTSWKSRFITVESEHSAMAACIASSLAGARTFTATSSQGIALMHELLHWASAQRLPIVMVDVNRALAPGWNIWTDQTDSLAQRDTGWLQIYVSDCQEVFDTVVQAFRLAEMIDLPVMVVLDAFVLSHTGEQVIVPDVDTIRKFLPDRVPTFKLDVNKPQAFGGLLAPRYFQEVRQKLQEDMLNSLTVLESIDAEWAQLFGRSYPIVEGYRTEDADVVLLTSATVSQTSKVVVDRLRQRGIKVGSLKQRVFRPFPTRHLRRELRNVPKVACIDRNISFGHHGIFFEELKSALYGMPDGERPKAYGYIAGLGGRDITPDTIEEVVMRTIQRDEPDPETIWLGRGQP